MEAAAPQEVHERKRGPHPLAVAACLAAGAALILAAFPATAFLSRPLAGAGLGLGLLAAFSPGSARLRLLFSVVVCVVCGLVLTVSFLMPSLLGPRYEASRQKSSYDPDAVQVIPLQLTSRGTEGLETDGYADASRAMVQQGFVRVQITNAVVGPAQVVDSKKRFTKQSLLAIGVRVQHLGHGPTVRFIHWDTTGERKVPPATAVIDGQKLPLADTGSDVPLGVNYGSDLFPGREAEDLLVFDASTRPGSVRLELPAEAWGGKGVYRFQIPSSMIVKQQAKIPR